MRGNGLNPNSTMLTAHLSNSTMFTTHLSNSTMLAAHLSNSTMFTAHLSNSTMLTAHLSNSTMLTTHLSISTMLTTHLSISTMLTAHLSISTMFTAHLSNSCNWYVVKVVLFLRCFLLLKLSSLDFISVSKSECAAFLVSWSIRRNIIDKICIIWKHIYRKMFTSCRLERGHNCWIWWTCM